MDDLIKRLERAPKGSRELDAEIYLAGEIQLTAAVQAAWNAPCPLDRYALSCVDWYGFQFTRELSAAKRLVPKHERGGWFWRVGYGSAYPGWAHLNKFHPDHCDKEDEITAHAATPELALCIAALKARALPHAHDKGQDND